MKKLLLSLCTLSCMVFVSSLQGSDLSNDAPASGEVEVSEGQEAEESPGTPVTPGSDSAKKQANRKMWQSIGIAVGAVAIAVTALILVSNHHGKKASH